MAVFKDESGREWLIRRIVVLDLKRIKSECGVDLNRAMSSYEGLADEVFDDTGEKAVSVLYYFCREQAKERGVSEDDFAGIFTGDVLEQARQALVEEMGFFSPRSPIGMVMKDEKTRRAFWNKTATLTSQTIQRRLDKLTLDDLPTS